MRKATIVIASLAALCGCASTTDTTATTPTPEPTPEVTPEPTPAEEEYAFPSVAEEFVFDFYREAIERRVEAEEFFTEDELRWYEANDYQITNDGGAIYKYDSFYKEGEYLYYPVIVHIEGLTNYLDEPTILYTNEDGYIYDGHHFEGLHISYDVLESLGEEYKLIDSSTYSAVIYGPEGVQQYRFGKVIDTVPVQGTYCGNSFWVGFLFRDGSDVYAVKWDRNQDKYYSQVIAHDVEYVIDSDYCFGSDPWSQPLFLMKDGSIKCYIDWINPQEPDSTENLVEPQYEGGYQR